MVGRVVALYGHCPVFVFAGFCGDFFGAACNEDAFVDFVGDVFEGGWFLEVDTGVEACFDDAVAGFFDFGRVRFSRRRFVAERHRHIDVTPLGVTDSGNLCCCFDVGGGALVFEFESEHYFAVGIERPNVCNVEVFI